MRITLRLILSVVLVAGVVTCLCAGLQARQAQRRLEQELARKSRVLAETLRESVEALSAPEKPAALIALADRFGEQEAVVGVAVYGPDGRLLESSPDLPAAFRALPDVARDSIDTNQGRGIFLGEQRGPGAPGPWYLQASPLHLEGGRAGAFVLVHDAGGLGAQWFSLWGQLVVRLLLPILLISLTALLVVHWCLVRPLIKTIDWMKRIRTGGITEHEGLPKQGALAPLAHELTQMAKSLITARAVAEEEAKLRLTGQSRWTAERLKEHVRAVLQDRPLLVIANREPYMHVSQGRDIRCLVPPSGLVTAVEPILRACGGTWIAHGSGDADRHTADSAGRLKVPPESPAYTLRRVWLDHQEEQGYYYGFANEGLWPLCHIAHTRPSFRAEDWAHYQRVNAKFMEAALEELESTQDPCILIQDYHFALLPRMIKERRPDAKIALFWHIPWPNPEAFDICPWARELLHGMLGADLLGFHIQFHCNNFLDTVDRTLESRIDWEQFAVNRADHTTWVKPFPISIAFPEEPTPFQPPASSPPSKAVLVKDLGHQVEWLGVGVDRIDYTKGITERFRAVERLFEKHPALRERFTFIQIGAPSRTLIKRYQEIGVDLEREAERIIQRFQTRDWKPIVFLSKSHSHEELTPFYRAADVCLVTSLHDGMNLVAKEFVAARTDQRGVLILSRFTGASRELRDALLVNPYDIDQVADAMYYGLTMDPEEQQARMSRMREVLEQHNVYRWAANLITELAQIRALPSQIPVSSEGARHDPIHSASRNVLTGMKP